MCDASSSLFLATKQQDLNEFDNGIVSTEGELLGMMKFAHHLSENDPNLQAELAEEIDRLAGEIDTLREKITRETDKEENFKICSKKIYYTNGVRCTSGLVEIGLLVFGIAGVAVPQLGLPATIVANTVAAVISKFNDYASYVKEKRAARVGKLGELKYGAERLDANIDNIRTLWLGRREVASGTLQSILKAAANKFSQGRAGRKKNVNVSRADVFSSMEAGLLREEEGSPEGGEKIALLPSEKSRSGTSVPSRMEQGLLQEEETVASLPPEDTV
ncbi:MAG: hypothetical protein OXF02_01060 [Simkaniaceae bacterium]|nr:hypothetical protein [Simkaniaceae bacterium]